VIETRPHSAGPADWPFRLVKAVMRRSSVDVVGSDGTVVWPDCASGPDPLLAIVSAGQRYLG
jgi:hypothetical protein